MNARDFLHVVFHEAKLQSRSWLFRLFVLFSLTFIVCCHVYWQGQNCEHWRMVAFPCSLPLMNAYLFSLIQGLFLSVMVAGLPSRMLSRGEMEAIHVRPVSNVMFFLGSLAGIGLLFLCLNVVVIVATVFLVHMTSLAEYSFGYYLFYLLTLNMPAWVIVAGFGTWTSFYTGSRILSIFLSVAWWLGCLFWLPYHFHGTLDYLGSGIPNLFSDLVGHVNLRLYLLQRAGWLLMGGGLLFLCVRRMMRLPNVDMVKRRLGGIGLLLVAAGGFSLCLVELDYFHSRSMRRGLRESFERYWSPFTCRVGSHDIELEQRGGVLHSCSDMRVYNPNSESLERLVFFLNPGLQVAGVSDGNEELPFQREGHVLVVERELGSGNTLFLRVKYSGEVDDVCCDLHLPDDEFEDVFHGDLFFPTGRRGAFVGDDLLLLTPASMWYPVAFPPVNPLLPLATARDFTRFHLLVKGEWQCELFSQGVHLKDKSGVSFTYENALSGISLYGGNLKRFTLAAGEVYNLQFGLTEWGKNFSRRLPCLQQDSVVSFLNHTEENLKTIPERVWYNQEEPNLSFFEVPISFYLSSHSGKQEAGMVEPGMVFFHERGFDMDLVETANLQMIENDGELKSFTWMLYNVLFAWGSYRAVCHPLLEYGKQYPWINESMGKSLWRVGRNRVYSAKDPLAGKMFEYLQDEEKMLPMGLDNVVVADLWRLHERYDCLLGRNLKDVLKEVCFGHQEKNEIFELKMQDFWLRLGLYIPAKELELALDSLSCREGEVSYEALFREWSRRWNVDFLALVEEWEAATHAQFYRTSGMVRYLDKKKGIQVAEGMVLNAGRCGGVVTLATGEMFTRRDIEVFNCYLAPGEVKKFRIVVQEEDYEDEKVWKTMSKDIFPLYFGVSANRPVMADFVSSERDLSAYDGKAGCTWEDSTPEEFWAGIPRNEVVVDDSDAGFELVEGNLNWLQRRLQKRTRPLEFLSEVRQWTPYLNARAQGDSICCYHRINGGSGRSTATWRVTLPEAGRYRVMGLAHKSANNSIGGVPLGIVYYYTVRGGEWEKNVEVPMDLHFPGKWGGSGWVDIGEFDFPAGEASVTLSDREAQGREEVTIVADAVKWVRLE